MTQILFIAAAICFACGALGVAARIHWTDAGFFFLTIALFLI